MAMLNLQSFYPECLRITETIETDTQITIKLKSLKHQQECQICGQEMSGYHGTYVRTVQDLPILGKNVILKITAYEYNCLNEDCAQKTFADDYNEFLSKFSRMTNRCEDFIKILALSTSCEGAAMICSKIGLKVSGDTIILMLKKTVSGDNTVTKCSDTIGIDDFAYRKGQTYCTVVCDWQTRKPVKILAGRDGESLKKWLQENKHIKKVTRDRAGAYAKAISEALPEAMQIADRFHLYQNLLSAVKEALKAELPNKIPILSTTPDIAEGTETEHRRDNRRQTGRKLSAQNETETKEVKKN